MMKSRQIRKKAADSDDERSDEREVKVLKSIPKNKKKTVNKKSTSSVLSFEESDNEEEATFQVKKTKESKTIKKRMMQAPGILDTANVMPSYDVSAGNAYDAEYLKSLREKQNFIAPTTLSSTTELDVIELSGDAAESFEDMVEDDQGSVVESLQQPPNHRDSHTKRGFTPLKPLDEISAAPRSKPALRDYIPLESSTSSISVDVRGGGAKGPDRRSGPGSGDEDEDEDEDSAVEEDRTWEEELARRGGVKKSATTPSRGDSAQSEVVPSSRGVGSVASSLPSRLGVSRGSGLASSSFPSLAGISSALHRNISALSEGCDRADRQLRSIESTLAAAKEEEAELTKRVTSREEQLSFLTVSACPDRDEDVLLRCYFI
jgi:hypothetical protein